MIRYIADQPAESLRYTYCRNRSLQPLGCLPVTFGRCFRSELPTMPFRWAD